MLKENSLSARNSFSPEPFKINATTPLVTVSETKVKIQKRVVVEETTEPETEVAEPEVTKTEREVTTVEREITEDNIQDGNIVLSNSAIPVSIKTSNNNIYPIEKDTLKEENGKFIIELEPYLAYENTEDFVSPWTVYYGGGAKGEKGDKGDKGDSAISVADPIVETLAPEEEATARAEIDEDGVVTFTFGIPQGDTGRLNVVVSETEPSNPVEGMIWIPSLY